MSSDEDDYMSDKFLQQCSDTRPGLVPKRIQEKFDKDKKQQEAQKQNKTVSIRKLEITQREAGLTASIPIESKGFALLQKMGYKPGMGIGKKGTGRIEPVTIEVKNNRLGLGKDADMKRKAHEMSHMRTKMEAKRAKADEKRQENFMGRLKERFSSISVERDLKKAQKVCLQLDQEQGLVEPGEIFFWPDNCLPSQKTDEDENEEEQHKDCLEETYDDSDLDEDEVLECPAYLEFSGFERLDILTRYLRNSYCYCLWCGVRYNDQQDLGSNCPGNSSEAHD
ncbi:G patch domain-containing protein 11 [Bulinus truncatus]|nr:G patch domain-containing protein 11 [Bulinus truncatus]